MPLWRYDPTRKVRDLILRHSVMGVVDGGSMLSIYAASTGGDKTDMRYLVAYYYLVFSIFQVVVLLTTGRLEISYNLLSPVISVAVYLTLGNQGIPARLGAGLQVSVHGLHGGLRDGAAG